MTLDTACRGCAAPGEPHRLLELGPQPPSNRFVREGERQTDRHPLTLGQCGRCGLLQLIDPMSPDMVRARFDWITYNEPEGHLDQVADRIRDRLPAGGARILGATYKDDTTLKRLEERGFPAAYRFDPVEDLGIDAPHASLETIQAALGPGLDRGVAQRHGGADLVVARHVLEHAHDPGAFLDCLLGFARPGGSVMLEVPDSGKFVGAGDHCFLWEEHIAYFTEHTLEELLRRRGCTDIEIRRFPYPMEDSLVAMVRVPESPPEASVPDDAGPPAAELEAGRHFAERFPVVRAAYQRHLGHLRERGKRVAAFGAGHLAAKFINFYGLGAFIDSVIDDNPDKAGLRMPGSLLPVVGSGVLESGTVDLCLLSLSPESEARVLERRAAYVRAGGVFRSMFSLSPLGLWADIAGEDA